MRMRTAVEPEKTAEADAVSRAPEGGGSVTGDAARAPESAPAPPAPAIPELPGEARQRLARRTRLSGAWVGVVVGAVVLALLLVFILQNTKSVKVSFFSLSGSMPLGVALLLSAVGGVLLAGVVASLRIWQLRRRLNTPGRSGRRTASTTSTT